MRVTHQSTRASLPILQSHCDDGDEHAVPLLQSSPLSPPHHVVASGISLSSILSAERAAGCQRLFVLQRFVSHRPRDQLLGS